MSLVHNKVLPLVLFKGSVADVDALISGQANIKLPFNKLFLDDLLTEFHLWVEMNNSEEWSPF